MPSSTKALEWNKFPLSSFRGFKNAFSWAGCRLISTQVLQAGYISCPLRDLRSSWFFSYARGDDGEAALAGLAAMSTLETLMIELKKEYVRLPRLVSGWALAGTRLGSTAER